MKELFIQTRNKIIHVLYKNILKRIFFQFDPENIHDFFINTGKILGSNFITKSLTAMAFSYSNRKYLEQKIRGITFKNPIGLAAGFDKNAELTSLLGNVGFGFEEVGSVTGEPCEGNPKPRLWRLKESSGLVVYYGLKNNGCEEISKRLSKKKFYMPTGISVAKTNCRLTADKKEGIEDYVKAYKAFKDIGDYMTINISCPNAYGGEPFTSPEDLTDLLTAIMKSEKTKPIFIKMSPDLTEKEIDDIIEVAGKHKIDGFICTNLTKKRENKKIVEKDVPENGGISGKPVESLSNKMISHIYKKTHGKYVIIGCGGVFSAQDAYKKIKAGASLVQLITGMIFEGPQLISQINQGLVRLLKQDGYKNISEAIGKSA